MLTDGSRRPKTQIWAKQVPGSSRTLTKLHSVFQMDTGSLTSLLYFRRSFIIRMARLSPRRERKIATGGTSFKWYVDDGGPRNFKNGVTANYHANHTRTDNHGHS